MKKVMRFIFTSMLIVLLFGCEGMAALFHGAKPDDPSVTYTITFDGNGASGIAPPAQTVNAGTSIILPDKGGLTSTGNTFMGWNESAAGGGTTYSAGSSVKVSKSIIFYAQWIDVLTPQYTVTFNANGATSGTLPAAQTVHGGVSITIPNQGTLLFSGKIFTGWNTRADGAGTNYGTGDSFTVTADIALYAKWGEIQIETEFKTVRTAVKRITDSGRFNQPFDTVSFNDVFDINVNILKQQGYRTVSFYIRLNVREVDNNGAQYIFLFNSPAPLNNYLVSSLGFEHTVGAKDTSWWVHYEQELKFENISLDSFTNEFIIRYGASGDWEDDWENKDLKIKLVFK